MIGGVRLTGVAHEVEADVICSMLRVEGIECSAHLADSIESSGGWVEIVVDESDLAAAGELLASAEALSRERNGSAACSVLQRAAVHLRALA
jgi:hypothetical protein